MNISENPRQASQSSYRISSLNIASAISALLLSSCIHYSDEYQSVSPTVKNNPPPYRPLSELGNSSSNISVTDDTDAWTGLRDFLTSRPNSSDEEFVGDDGTIYTREELESANQ